MNFHEEMFRDFDVVNYAKICQIIGLTKTQRIANQFKQSQLRDLPAPQSMGSIYEVNFNF